MEFPRSPFQTADLPTQEALEKMSIRQRRRWKKVAERHLRSLTQERSCVLARVESYDAAIAWHESLGELALERNDSSRLHRFLEAEKADRVLTEDGSNIMRAEHPGYEHTFVVKHDWAGAFKNAVGLGEEFHLPYEVCAFEFRIAGRTVIASARHWPDHVPSAVFVAHVECGDYWLEIRDPVISFLKSQITAICIALEAEVATHSVIRAPHRLNEKRLRDGRVPVFDHHVVDLSRRHRVSNSNGSNGIGTRKRLHFRRGHWRHFVESKTWVKWCLVGDPDLGFVDKEYRI